MKDKVREKLLELNRVFYREVAEAFTQTRQGYNEGWFRLLDELMQIEADPIRVLDIGCGNARFKRFLDNHLSKAVVYKGIDFNELLLKEAALVAGSGAQVEKRDIFDLHYFRSLPRHDSEVVALFGVTHHVPGKEFRNLWFEELSELVNEKGILLYTFWDLQDDVRSRKLDKSFSLDNSKFTFSFKKSELEEGDYFYGWRTKKVKRYVHVYDDAEKLLIKQILERKGLSLQQRFSQDGRTGRLNDYWVWRKR